MTTSRADPSRAYFEADPIEGGHRSGLARIAEADPEPLADRLGVIIGEKFLPALCPE